MINNSIEKNQFEQDKTDQYNSSSFFNEYLAGKAKSFYEEIEERENEIPGIPQDIEEIKISPMPEKISDETAENFLKETTEYDKAYSFEVPKNPEDKEEKEEIKMSEEQKMEYMKFFFILMERMEQKQQFCCRDYGQRINCLS